MLPEKNFRSCFDSTFGQSVLLSLFGDATVKIFARYENAIFKIKSQFSHYIAYFTLSKYFNSSLSSLHTFILNHSYVPFNEIAQNCTYLYYTKDSPNYKGFTVKPNGKFVINYRKV